MDGYAVRVADVPGELIVAGEAAAGAVTEAVVRPGAAVRVMTGSLLPLGTEAVVPIEDTEASGDRIAVRVSTATGRYVRPAGSDVAAGEPVIPAGTRIGPAQIAALYATGHLQPLVQPTVRVAVIATGDELVPGGTAPGTAQLVDSNRPALLAAAAGAGATVIDGGIVRDDEQELIAKLDSVAGEVDLIITSGGVSVGAYDVVKSALLPIRQIHFERVAVQPGMPQAWGRYGDGGPAFLGLPGNPVSALVSFELFGRQVLGRPRPRERSVLSSPITGSPVDKLQLVRGLRSDHAIAPFGGTGSHLLVALARANALIVVPEGRIDLAVGADVEIIGLDQP
jgi:molybdopterin molybdotransferase